MSAADDAVPNYDLESVYDEQISPLMTKIIGICKDHKMPMIASFQYQKSEEDGVGYVTTALIGGDNFLPGGEKLRAAHSALAPVRPVSLAVTIVTNPDGSKRITSRRV